jgi:hypothetical protein
MGRATRQLIVIAGFALRAKLHIQAAMRPQRAALPL